MNDTQIKTLEQVRQFLGGTMAVEFAIESKEERYRWIHKTLVQFRYRRLNKADKGALLSFLAKVFPHPEQAPSEAVPQAGAPAAPTMHGQGLCREIYRRGHPAARAHR